MSASRRWAALCMSAAIGTCSFVPSAVVSSSAVSTSIAVRSPHPSRRSVRRTTSRHRRRRSLKRVASLTIPAVMTRAQMTAVVSHFRDWNIPLMVSISWCESRWEPRAWNPIVVWEDGIPKHSAGLLGVLAGSFNPAVNISQAHALWLVQGYGAWDASYACWG